MEFRVAGEQQLNARRPKSVDIYGTWRSCWVEQRHVSKIGKTLLSSNISSTCPHSMVNFGPLAAEIGPVVRDSPANFNGLRFLASLLQRRRSTESNQTLHNVWPLPGLVDYIYIFGGCCPVTEFFQVQNSLCVLEVLRSPIGSVTARHSSSGREPNFAALSTGRHLYSAERPSCWALARILVHTDIIGYDRLDFG